MNNVVNEYYNFFLNHHHQLSDYFKTKEYVRLSDETDVLEEQLLDLLEDKTEIKKAKNILADYVDAIYGQNSIMNQQMFEYAFLSGLKLGMDTEKAHVISQKLSSIRIDDELVDNL